MPHTALAQFLNDQEGVTLIEYALLAVLISTIAVTLITSVGNDVLTLYRNVSNKLAQAVAAMGA